jgi:uncharacterized membrane protein YdbT with pleckstrin-like domain
MEDSIIKKINLKVGEEIVRVVRHYVLTLWLQILGAFLLLILPFFLIFPFFRWGYWGVGIFLALIFLVIIYGIRIFIVWYYNAFVITNKRIIDIDQRGFFERIVSEVAFENIQDVSYRRSGIWQTIFRYGDVRIKLAGADEGFEIKNVRAPAAAEQLIYDLIHPSQRDRNGDPDLSVLAPNAEKFTIIKESINDFNEEQLEEIEGLVRGKLRQVKLKKIEEINDLPAEK